MTFSRMARCGALISLAMFAWLCVLWMYWPGQLGPALLDDRSSVEVLDSLSASPESAWDEVFANRSGPLGRPVSMASFVLERLFLGSDTATAKRTNIFLHVFNGILVFWLFLKLLQWMNVRHRSALALCLSLIWLVAPMQVSTVLYTVQRMAMLATTFMLLALIAYAFFRQYLRAGGWRLWASATAVVTCSVLALFAKENAAVLVPLVLVLEALWFQFRARASSPPPRRATRAALSVLTLGVIAAALVLAVGWDWITTGYERRHFDLPERLLTEARILWDYVAQWYVPDVQRMGLYHDDVVISSSIFQPATTAYSLAGWLAVLVVSGLLLRWRWGCYAVACILWYLVAHLPESTVLALELYFEHRNYFPAIGLTLLIGVCLAAVIKKWPQTGSPMVAFLVLYIVWLASQTGSQVQVWASRTMLVLNQVAFHPDSPRANTDMAVLLADVGAVDEAGRYSQRAFETSSGERSDDYRVRNLALSCMANRPVSEEKIALLGSDNKNRPLSSVTTLHTLVGLLQDNACPEFDRVGFADRMAVVFLENASADKASANIYASLAVLENTLGRYDNAYQYMGLFLAEKPESVRGLLMQLHFATALGKVGEVDALIAILENKKASGELTVAEAQNLALYTER